MTVKFSLGDDLCSASAIAASGMKVQAERMKVISENLSNDVFFQ